ncbi:MAG: hybrid sensor histidine kinase/response regulator [Elusimicrobia bacterium]|nr:hybrid sensor histidine kinase/response regulator [Elusimicrobiota bacterium]
MSDASDGSFMFDLFCAEVETHAATLTDGLLGLERGGGSAQAIEPLMRAAHSIKGAARIIGVDAAVKVAHAMEDCFVAVQAGRTALGPADVDVLLSGVDWLKKVPAAADRATCALPEADVRLAEETTARIRALGTGAQSAPAPAVPVPAPPPAPAVSEVPQVPAGRTSSPPAREEDARAPATARPGAQEPQRIVRVDAAGLERIMTLSGELFVQAGRLEAVSAALGRMRSASDRMGGMLERAFQAAEAGDVARAVELVLLGKQQNERCGRGLAASEADFEAVRRRMLGTSERLYHEVRSSKMRPFADCAQGFPRMVRDISKSVGKVVRLQLAGLNTGVDRDIMEKLESPLTHLLRNAIDHGIEAPERRINAGKPMEGVIVMEAWHAAGMLVISIADDGAGVDFARLKRTIVERKLTTAELVERMSEAELLDFILLPGFSTRDAVTELSGRGVGLDIVQNMLQEVGGTLRMESKPGRGTSFTLRLPLTLSVMKAVIAEISGQPYAFPLSRTSRCLRVPRDQVVLEDGLPCLETEEGRVRLVRAAEVLELPGPGAADGAVSAVVIGDGAGRCALEVDRLLGERRIAVRPLDSRLGKVQDVSAAAVLDDGTPVLILDAEDLLRSAELAGTRDRTGDDGAGRAGPRAARRVLVVDDSPTVREVERQILEKAGYEVDMSINGMDAWNAIQSAHYDAVISDIDMPRMNGLELVRRIRGDQRRPRLPVVIVSYKDSPGDRERGLEAGADLYLSKSSFQDDTLLRAVQEFLGQAAA